MISYNWSILEKEKKGKTQKGKHKTILWVFCLFIYDQINPKLWQSWTVQMKTVSLCETVLNHNLKKKTNHKRNLSSVCGEMNTFQSRGAW